MKTEIAKIRVSKKDGETIIVPSCIAEEPIAISMGRVSDTEWELCVYKRTNTTEEVLGKLISFILGLAVVFTASLLGVMIGR